MLVYVAFSAASRQPAPSAQSGQVCARRLGSVRIGARKSNVRQSGNCASWCAKLRAHFAHSTEGNARASKGGLSAAAVARVFTASTAAALKPCDGRRRRATGTLAANGKLILPPLLESTCGSLERTHTHTHSKKAHTKHSNTHTHHHHTNTRHISKLPLKSISQEFIYSRILISLYLLFSLKLPQIYYIYTNNNSQQHYVTCLKC